MPSNSKLFVKPFIGGINTELSSVEDAILYTADELNCTILPEGIRGRRLGFNIERDGVWVKRDPTTTYSGFYWSNVNKKGQNFIVQQVNTTLHFYDGYQKPFSVLLEDLETFIEKHDEDIKNFYGKDEYTPEEAATYYRRSRGSYIGSCDISSFCLEEANNTIEPLRYAIGDGNLFAVCKDIRPIVIKHTESGQFVVQGFSLYIRDSEGLNDGLGVEEMPLAEGISEDKPFGNLTVEHHYNLLNQGWSDKEILNFQDDKSKWPSNNLQWFIGKDDSGEFKTEKLLRQYFGNTPAPKGHYIIDYFDKDRSSVSGLYVGAKRSSFNLHKWHVRDREIRGDDNYKEGIKTMSKSLTSLGGDLYGFTLKTVILNFTTLRRKSGKKSYDDSWSGKIIYTVHGGRIPYENLTDEQQEQLNKLAQFGYVKVSSKDEKGRTIYNTFTEVEDIIKVKWERIHEEDDYVYGASSSEPHVVRMLLDNESRYDFYKLECRFSDGNGVDIINPIEIVGNIYWSGEGEGFEKDTDLLASTSSDRSITDITYMPGRLFYLVNDTVLFSQVVKESGEGFDKCYQDADPTSEEISDVIPTDGGYVKFNNLGVGRALETFNRGVLVFGENIVYGLISPLEKNFTATEYDIVELSRAGLIGDRSVVSTDNMVYYWSPLGIFRIGINPQTGSSLIAESVTHSTIQEWYDRISNRSKETCRGCFDYVNNRIYWYFADEYTHKLNRCLVYDLTYNSFMPFKLEGEEFIADVFNTKSTYEISPTLYVRVNGERVVANEAPVIAVEEDEEFKRWTAIQHIIADDIGNVSFGDYNSREFRDFDKHEYDSYMVSRPIMFAGFSAFGNAIQDTSADKQVPILQTLFKRTEQAKLTGSKNYIAASGANIRMRWGWALDERSNRWDMVQNGYRPQKDFLHDEYVESRIHVRGRGKAFQVEIRNDDNKDFRLAGMNLLVRSK